MGYIKIILTAFAVFPMIAFVITLPYVLAEYHKYGSIHKLRVVIVYSFVLYLLTAYFLVILPLPSIEEVLTYTTRRVQLVPFQFVRDFFEQTHVVLTDPKTYLYFLKDSCSSQVLYNLFLTVPFGIYLRYYYRLSFSKTVLFSFFLSLFFELTQLSGLYFIYPRGYRLFDVDDLIINTLGGMVGYFLGAIVLKILPSREEIDRKSFEMGTKVTLFRRFLSFVFDSFFLIFGMFIASFFTDVSILSYSVLVFLLFFFVPCLFHGQTLSQRFFRLKVWTLDKNGKETKTLKKVWFFLRIFLFYFVFLLFPFYLSYLQEILEPYFSSFLLRTIRMVGNVLFYLFFFLVPMIKKNPFFYERLSRTRLVSTITIEEKEADRVEEREEENLSRENDV